MIEVANKFNMVDMGGIDVVESQGETVPGLYTKLLNSIQNCRYTVLYNWSFAGIQITPTPTEITIGDNTVIINDAISVTSDDVVHIYSIEVPIYPELEELNVIENGEYVPSEGIYGFSRARVEVPPPPLETLTVTSNGIYVPEGNVDGWNRVTVNVVDNPFFIIDPSKMDTMAAATPQITTGTSPSIYNVASVSYVSFIAKMNNPSDAASCWISRKGTYNGESNKGFLGRSGRDRSGIILLPKISSTYSNLHIRYEVTSGYYPDAFLRIDLLKNMRFLANDVWPRDEDILYHRDLATDLVSDTALDIDISSIQEDFYVYLGDYSGFVKIRELYFN